MKQSKSPAPLIEHCGVDPETNWHKLRVDGRSFFGVGSLQPAAKLGIAEATIPAKSHFLVRGHGEGLYWLVGGLFPPSKAAVREALSALARESLNNHGKVLPEVAQGPASDGPAIQSSQWFVLELERVKSMKSAGLDPRVGMRFLVRYLNESRPSLSRKVGKELPVPTKRGNRNFWLLSEVDAYADGKRVSR